MSNVVSIGRVVVLGLLACLVAQPLVAQTTLISNLDGNDGTQSAGLSTTRNKGMGFTMPAGQDYTLDFITLRLETSGVTTPVVQIWTNVSGLPGTVIETLANPTLATSGIANYDFTSSGTVLAAGTSYWIVAYATAASAAYDWKASSPAQIPTGIATHLGALFDTNGPPPTSTSSIICSYSITGSLSGGGESDIEVTKTGQTTSMTTGVYTIRVDNLGPDDATGVVVTDTLPGGVTYVSDDCGGTPGTPWTWNLGALANGAFDVCHIDVTITDPANTANVANATADQTDPNTANNTSTAQLPPFGGPIPTLGTLGTLVLIGLIAGCGLLAVRRFL
jgi:uncharacterized repeat protein (TIGR01451 family)